MTSKRNTEKLEKHILPLTVRNKFEELQQRLSITLMTILPFYTTHLPIHHM